MLWWSDELKIGIDTVDEQHKGIFDRVDRILSLGPNTNRGTVKEIFEFLVQYVVVHFKDEEAVMESAGYPDIEEHKKQHMTITAELRKIVDKVKKEGINEKNLDALKLLVIEWLIVHISESDRKIAVFIRGGSEDED